MNERPKTFEENLADIRHRQAARRDDHWNRPRSLAGPVVGGMVAYAVTATCNGMRLDGGVTTVAALGIGLTVGMLVTKVLQRPRTNDR